MADEIAGNAPSVREGWTVRVWFAAVSTVLAFVLIGLLVVYGNPANVLHQTALNSAFYLVYGVLAGFGLGVVIPNITELFTRK